MNEIWVACGTGLEFKAEAILLNTSTKAIIALYSHIIPSVPGRGGRVERNLKCGKNLWEVGEQRLGSEIPKVLEMEINYCIPLHSIMTSTCRKKKKKQ